MAKTRESLFSMLESRGIDWEGARVLDLFAGTGSLAFEALSRGADSAVLVDNSRELCALQARNVAAFQLEGKCRILQEDVTRFLRRPGSMSFNLVFVDPPYRRNYTATALNLLARGPWLAEGAFVVAELEHDLEIATPENLSPECERLFGQTRLKIWKRI